MIKSPSLSPVPEQETLDSKIIERGKEFFQAIQDEKPSLFNTSHWVGKVLDWAMKHDSFKINLFRFVDVFPYLKSGKSLTRHIREYFVEDGGDIPGALKWAAKLATLTGPLGSKLLNVAISMNIKGMARQFIIGEGEEDTIKNLEKLRSEGFAAVVDLLGEATITEREAEEHLEEYLTLLDNLDKHQHKWKGLPAIASGKSADGKDWGYSPPIQIAVKLTALYSQIKPQDFENSVQNILKRLKVIYRKIIEVGGTLYIDMESYTYKSITIDVFKRLRSDSEFRNYKCLGLVLQAYLKETEEDAKDLLEWAREENLPIEVRLVKGAYWDYETIIARQNHWTPCVWQKKAETDAAFERIAHEFLKNHDICYFACGSHNIRSISAVIEMAEELKVPSDRYEFQVLYGMAEPVRKALRNIAGRVRLYCPYGEMIPGMGYLVRRLLENTSNESFLRQSFVEETEKEKLLQNPLKTLEEN